MRFLLPSFLIVSMSVPAFGKLPPPGEEAKTKAAEVAARAAWSEKVGLYKHCLVTERIAKSYGKSGAAATQGATAPASASDPAGIPPCADPGPFAMPAPVAAAASGAKPVEAAGAHSPPATAATPSSTKQGSAELNANSRATPVTPIQDKPIEASEAHSRPGTAIAPPSVNATAKELGTGKK